VVVRVADRVKTLVAQGSDGSFSGVREYDILTAALRTLEHVHQPLQQAEELWQSPLQKENQDKKPLSKDEILNCIIGTKQERPNYKPDAPILLEANIEAAGPNCTRFHAYVMEHSKDKLAF
jgi:hypothetical protein